MNPLRIWWALREQWRKFRNPPYISIRYSGQLTQSNMTINVSAHAGHNIGVIGVYSYKWDERAEAEAMMNAEPLARMLRVRLHDERPYQCRKFHHITQEHGVQRGLVLGKETLTHTGEMEPTLFYHVRLYGQSHTYYVPADECEAEKRGVIEFHDPTPAKYYECGEGYAHPIGQKCTGQCVLRG